MEIESGGANGPSSRRNRSNLPGFIEFFVLFVRARVCLCVCECVCVCVCVCVLLLPLDYLSKKDVWRRPIKFNFKFHRVQVG